ncbi:radical SAM protein [Metabacillus rhizolycopersici]|uniref:Radical SAM protein n=1 Tax=Metabacillus rhizolycopersici TaxID=2875709 RepID=A0ABS7UZA7_9BACI|nr:radical SAM protein [Metabacillus rhizolycopersici]MBZ5753359.1 radical SAM protein [Metabacillus rhizolycopersici]
MEKSYNFIIKITSTCNLNCSYCYMFNMGDNSFLRKPKIMHKEVATNALKRIFEYACRNNTKVVRITLHGGEPLLAGKEWMEWFFNEVLDLAPDNLQVAVNIQTNGVLLDKQWIHLFSSYNIGIGISIDGPQEWHDKYRTDHLGRGSYKDVKRAINLLIASEYSKIGWGVLSVANPEFSGVDIYNHFKSLGIKEMDFLWPDYHYDNPPKWPPGSLAQYYIGIFDQWYNDQDTTIKVRWINGVIKALLVGTSNVSGLGGTPVTDVVIETDGSLEPYDAIRTCGNEMTRLGLNVVQDTIESLRETDLFQMCAKNNDLLSNECLNCSILSVCGGGSIVHRWSGKNGFRNPSVYCQDLKLIIEHMQNRIISDLYQHKIIS